MVATEIASLGGAQIKLTTAGVTFSGTLEVGLRCALWSRLASRILLQVGQFQIRSKDDLYREAKKIPWAQHFDEDHTFSCFFTHRGNLSFPGHLGTLTLKDGIADHFREHCGRRPSVDKDYPHISITGHAERGVCSVYINLSGDPLHRRGYRLGQGPAPIRENVAAAMLMRMGWQKAVQQANEDGKPFGLYDPMCGSGTILIEAAMIASDTAPGLLRTTHWGFTHWKKFDQGVWDGLIAEAKERKKQGFKAIPTLVGSDKDGKALAFARKNCHRAGFDGYITWRTRDLTTVIETPPELPEHGFLLTNPPYGVRLEEVATIGPLYKQLGQLFSGQFPEYTMGIICPSKELSFATELRSEKHYALDNGSIPCRLYTYSTPNLFKREIDPTKGAESFKNRLKKNLKTLQKWANTQRVSCYRIYDADLPEYNCAIDWYEGKWANIQEYAPPSHINQEKSARRMQEVAKAVSEVLGLESEAVFLKERKRQKGSAQYSSNKERADKQGDMYRIYEHGYSCWVNFTDYLDTGIFLDHRPIRKWLQENAMGKRFLNLFCYTGVATVAAATGGALSSLSIDTSNTYLGWAENNFRLNEISDTLHKLEKAECFQWLKEDTGLYDLIFLDPPTFSNNKSRGEKFDIQSDHVALIQLAFDRLAPGGTLIFSTNMRSFKMEWQPPMSENARTPRSKGGSIKNITKESIPEDFARNQRSQKIHQCWRIEKR